MASETPRRYPPVLITPGPGTGQLGTIPMPYSAPKQFRLANPKPAYPALLFFATETTIKTLAHSFLPPDLTLVLPRVALQDLAYPLLLGSVSNRLSFRWQVSPVCW